MKTIIYFIIILLSFDSSAQIITTYVGTGIHGYSGDWGLADTATIALPVGINLDDSGNLLICQQDLVRKVNLATNIISTIAGDTVAIGIGDGGFSDSALVDMPYSVCVDAIGNLYILDYWAMEVRKVNVSNGIISDYAGTTLMAGVTGDGGPADSAKLDAASVCLDTARKTLYISDEWNHKVRKVDMTTGIITTFAGTGVNGYSGDGGQADSAEFSRTLGICLDRSGNVYIGDWDNARIREVNISTGIITTIAGNGTAGYSGDNGLAINAMIDRPTALCFDTCSNLYFTDEDNQRIRRIDATTGNITTVAGNGTAGYFGDGGPAIDAEFDHPSGICIDQSGSIYISDYYNNRVRKITYDTSSCTGLPNTNINSIKNKVEVSVYPNPANDILNIDNVKTHTTYKLLNLVGATIQQGAIQQGDNSISVQSLSSGMYMLELTDNEGQKTVHKIVKQ